MQERATVLKDYEYTGITGEVYHPVFKDSKWYLVDHLPRMLSNIIHLCNIPEDEAVILKLKYGS
jgi:hypothetical protein